MNTDWNRRRGNSDKGKRTEMQRKKTEKWVDRLLLRLIASAAIFLLVFVGGHLLPERAINVFGGVRQAISADLDLSASVESIGNSIRAGESVPAALREWCVDTFLPVSMDESAKKQVQEQLSASTFYRSHLIAPQVNVVSLQRR